MAKVPAAAHWRKGLGPTKETLPPKAAYSHPDDDCEFHMRRLTSGLLILLTVAALALAAVAQLGVVHLPVPPIGFLVAAIVFVALLAILAALTAGLAYFQFVIKPGVVKGFISAAFAPKPTSVWAQEATVEQWPPQLSAIGTLRAYQGIFIAPQVAG